jgi:hypothetical protein
MHCGYTGISTLDVTILTSKKNRAAPSGSRGFLHESTGSAKQ